MSVFLLLWSILMVIPIIMLFSTQRFKIQIIKKYTWWTRTRFNNNLAHFSEQYNNYGVYLKQNQILCTPKKFCKKTCSCMWIQVLSPMLITFELNIGITYCSLICLQYYISRGIFGQVESLSHELPWDLAYGSGRKPLHRLLFTLKYVVMV